MIARYMNEAGSMVPRDNGAWVIHTDCAAMREALQHIKLGHDVVCFQCGWVGYKKEAQSYFFLVCPECQCQAIRTGADEIAAYALRQIEGGGE